MAVKKQQTNSDETVGSKGFLWIAIGVVLLWFLSGIVIYFMADNWSDRGTIGDMFGVVNALFSGLAFVGLLYAIYLQREDLKLNREEVRMNRRELKKSAEAQEKSEQALVKQTEQMHLSARLNAMNTIINYYNIQIANPNNPPEIVERAKAKRKEIIKQIDVLIEGLHDSDVED